MEKKISVVIPNFNGEKLLAKNLPNVIKYFPGCEIIVVDDASVDNSKKLIRENFKKVKLISFSKNQGFAKAVNRGAYEAKGKLIVFLNSDVSPRRNFLNSVVKYFNKKNTFSVGFLDYSHEEDGKIIKKGRGGAKFEKGFIFHFALDPQKGETLWVSGGSGIFDREKFLKLGGFDSLYNPFYWEDIDIGLSAWKTGYKCYFEPKAEVDHFHEEGAIKKTKSDFYIKTASYKNQFLLVWKNGEEIFLILKHLIWIPYHFLTSLLRLDFAFYSGFIWACLSIFKKILEFNEIENKFQYSTSFILRKFNNQPSNHSS